MSNPKVGDFLISKGYANVWDNPGDVVISQIVDFIDENQHVVVLEIYKRRFNKHDITELKILTPGGNIGWVGIETIIG